MSIRGQAGMIADLGAANQDRMPRSRRLPETISSLLALMFPLELPGRLGDASPEAAVIDHDAARVTPRDVPAWEVAFDVVTLREFCSAQVVEAANPRQGRVDAPVRSVDRSPHRAACQDAC
jgi:hypothetical protein